MTPGTAVAPARLARQRRSWLVLLAVAAMAAGALGWRAMHPPRPAAIPPPVDDLACVSAPEPGPPGPIAPPEPSKAKPGPETWTALERCLADGVNFGSPNMARVTVAQVRGWIAEGDPVWLESGRWWLPLSGEGLRDMPSGLYISVPLDGAPCGGAIVN